MKKLMGLCAALLLCACATPQHAFESDPDGYGLFVATSNIFADSKVVVQQEGSGTMFQIQVRHLGGGSDTGYLMASLPPGRYSLQAYSPDGVNSYALTTANGWFEVQTNCFNYGGRYDFEQDADGLPSYTNTTTLQDIASLPGHYRDLAEDRDICGAAMGKPGDRLKAADVKGQLDL